MNARPCCWIPCFWMIGWLALTAPDGRAQGEPNHLELPPLDELIRALDNGPLELDHLRTMGLLVFTTPFNTLDGYGDGPFDPREWEEGPMLMGHRPTLQGNGTLLRVHGLDAQSCNECHSIVSHATRPPTLGIGGVGAAVQNAIIFPTLIDVADSSDDRTRHAAGHDPNLPMRPDGVADFNGRFANPPFLFGGGGVELLAKEMTADLQEALAKARRSSPGTVTRLETHGVSFGSLRTLKQRTRAGRDVDLSEVQGVGLGGASPEDALVVRPFGRKGENFSMRDFDRGAMQFHFGVQPAEVIGEEVDEDGDGLVDEASVAMMSVLHIFDVTNPVPRQSTMDESAERGAGLFREIGCADCHVPALKTRSRFLPLAYPENPADPSENVYLRIDLTKVGFKPAPGGGVWVPLFADLKRHEMGEELAETLEVDFGIPNEQFTTARLWGIHDTEPYLHDGRAQTLGEAIRFHGGEAGAARGRYVALPDERQRDVLAFLATLRVPPDPNQELLPIVKEVLEWAR